MISRADIRSSPPARHWRALRAFVHSRLDRKSELGLWLTVDVLVLAGAVWAFAGLLEEVLDNDALVRWDVATNAWFHTHASPLGLRLFDAITELGSPGEWVVIALAAGWLFWRRERFLLLAWLGGNAGGGLMEFALKLSVHRKRPQYAAAYLRGHSYSFPSGHTMSATVCYSLLVFVVATSMGWHARRRVRLYAAAAAIATLVGFSRIYLGVHYPSDVLGGLAAGAAWVTLCLAAIRLALGRAAARPSERRGKLPTPDQGVPD
jgi:undecaprenyl-diphosphatase